MTDTELEQVEKVFYGFWEKVLNEMPDDAMEATMTMIKKFNALNDLVREYHTYRNDPDFLYNEH